VSSTKFSSNAKPRLSQTGFLIVWYTPSMSWLSNLTNWFRRSPERSEEPCTDDRLRSMRRDLEAEQRGLATDLERLFIAYDERMRGLSSRLSTLDDATLEREWDSVRSQQTDIRRLLQRFESSVRSRQELERELAAWESRTDGDERAEIIRSELAVRGVRRASPKKIETPPPLAISGPLNFPEIFISELFPGDESENEVQAPAVETHELPPVRSEDLIAAIRDAVREAERWHAVPEASMGEDALVQLHHVRELHGLLRRLDRQNGIRRDRANLAVHPRGLKILVDA
jgi:hypothetical protein